MSNIETTREYCLRKCSRTFMREHGGAVPGGPFPGTHGSPGDVRRCEHGRVWLFREDDRFGFDLWDELSPVWSPFRYRRAVRALSSPQPPTTGEAA